MKKRIIVILCTSLLGFEVLLFSAAGNINFLILGFSVALLALGCSGLILLVRMPINSAPPVASMEAQAYSAEYEQHVFIEDQESFPGPEQSLDADSPVSALSGEIEIYQKAIPAFFQSVVDYLSKTTEPISENLFVIKTNIKNFIVQVQEHDQEIINSTTLDLMRGHVDDLQSNIHQVTQKTGDAFIVFEKKFHDLQKVLESVFRLTGDIADIAERVHVLSINASIESARAGVHGRGFKVIANEIQKLAHETQSFLKDIKLTAGTSQEIFISADQELEENKTSLTTMVQQEKETFDNLNGSITRHYGQFKNLYSGILQFVDGLEENMKDLFPLSMLHAIIIQELENLGLVSGDFLQIIGEYFPPSSSPDENAESRAVIERLRKRLTTSRELDALEKVVRDLGLDWEIDLQRSSNEYELF